MKKPEPKKVRRRFLGIWFISRRDYGSKGCWQTEDGQIAIVKTLGLEPWEVYRRDPERPDDLMAGDFVTCGHSMTWAVKAWQEEEEIKRLKAAKGPTCPRCASWRVEQVGLRRHSCRACGKRWSIKPKPNENPIQTH